MIFSFFGESRQRLEKKNLGKIFFRNRGFFDPRALQDLGADVVRPFSKPWETKIFWAKA